MMMISMSHKVSSDANNQKGFVYHRKKTSGRTMPQRQRSARNGLTNIIPYKTVTALFGGM